MSLHRIASAALVLALAETKGANQRFARRRMKQKEKEGLCYDDD